ncbi:zinc-binding alcohol dehydrogenase family protein [Ohtaekwangia koreensis]|uniref:NADPH:quinone reductase n=1 Tax=Ohtaekwangia koreensis TaxID=688867 RepID=A0A1T5JRI5_9BACT|nr:zinc-binding alcohol dehydrogenase family protein [Ohtaekwangia koreensis]SKC53986.1 NADPH:quinone reductase [Ohtaekwangia koreensis]
MKAAVLYKPGDPENFTIEERPIPTAWPGQVLIKVKAFGLNRSEIMTRKGFSPNVKFPRILGIECVGEVESDPLGILKKGQQVAAAMGEMGRLYDGSYAEYTLLPHSIIFPFKSHLPWEQLGAFPEMFQTTYGSLHLALKITKGETLLIRGGTSSIGMLATQLAKNSGLTVIATTRNSEKKKLLLQNGADEVLIDDGKVALNLRNILPEGVDKVLELIGISTLQDSLQCAKLGGAVCMTGMLSEQWSLKEFAPMEYIPPTVNLTVYDSGLIKIEAAHFQEFIQDAEAGKINLNVSRVFTLNEIMEAHKLMESNTASGKIVIVP